MVYCPVIGSEDDPDDQSWQTFVESCCVVGIQKRSAECLLYIRSCPSVLEVTYKRSVILRIVMQVLWDNQGHLKSGTLGMCQLYNCVLRV